MKWLFILGCNNSGTTLLHDLIAQHPEIDKLKMEGHASPLWDSGAKHGVGRVWTEEPELFMTPECDPEELKESWLKMLEEVTKIRGSEYLLEKSPPDVLRAVWLRDNFPNSKFIGIVRNGYAVAEGIRRRSKGPRLLDGPAKSFEEEISITRAAAHWKKANFYLMCAAMYIEDFHLVYYEDLIRNPVGTLRGIEASLQLEPHEYETAHIVDKNLEQIAQLSEIEKSHISDVAEEGLTFFGYSEDYE